MRGGSMNELIEATKGEFSRKQFTIVFNGFEYDVTFKGHKQRYTIIINHEIKI